MTYKQHLQGQLLAQLLSVIALELSALLRPMLLSIPSGAVLSQVGYQTAKQRPLHSRQWFSILATALK